MKTELSLTYFILIKCEISVRNQSILGTSSKGYLIAHPSPEAPTHGNGHHPEHLLEGLLFGHVEVLQAVQRRLAQILSPDIVDLCLLGRIYEFLG